MSTITNASIPLKLFGAVLAAGPTQAQNATNTYDDPQPCGPGAGTAFQPEPHEVTTGHFALFDAYWQWTSSDNLDNTGVLRTNTCPPKLVKTTKTDDFGNSKTVTTLKPSGLDIDEAIFHVKDKHKATVVAGDADDTNLSHLSLVKFPDVKKYASVGDQVWWLRLDDPDFSEDLSSDLGLGFSTKRFDSQYWHADDGYPPFRFKFKLQRNPGIDPDEHPHLLTYRVHQQYVPGSRLVWDSNAADTSPLMLEAGELESLHWVFTKPGTYEISVQLQGWVRQKRPAGAGKDWLPISTKKTETSEVKRYVIQVGDALAEVEPPRFGVSRSVAENSAAGTDVGDPVLVFSEASDLEYSLSGDGHENFAVAATTDQDPYSVQIQVAEGASLDYETESTYDLILEVSNKIDHESNPDPAIDHTLAVRITLEDVPTGAVIQADNLNPVAGDTVTFTAAVTDFGDGNSVNYHFTDSRGTHTGSNTLSIQRDQPGTETVDLYVTYLPPGGDPQTDTQRIDADPVTVTWHSQ